MRDLVDRDSARMDSIVIRPLSPTEWAAFRDLRLEALKVAPGAFASSYQAEVTHTREEWQRTISGPGHQVFGLFDRGHLIGITAAFTWREDPSGETAILAMSFILPEYRGRGLSHLLYEARLEWIRAQGLSKRVIVSHRASNEVSRRLAERHGFVAIGRASRIWPDGSADDEIFYELWISNEDTIQPS